jgi:hypothetical protein
MEHLAMTDEDLPTNTPASLDSSSAMVRAESDHLDGTLHALVRRLSSVPGLTMTVSHRHGRLRRLIGDLPYINDLHRWSDPIDKVDVAVGPLTYWLQADRGSIRCGSQVTSVERGEAKEEMSFSVWANALFDEVARQNFVNHESMVALRHLVEQDRVD